MMRYGIEYMKKSESDYKEQERARREKILHQNAKQLGFKLVKDEPKAAASEAPS